MLGKYGRAEDVDDGDVVVVLDAAVPKWAPRAWIGILGFPDEDWGIRLDIGGYGGVINPPLVCRIPVRTF